MVVSLWSRLLAHPVDNRAIVRLSRRYFLNVQQAFGLLARTERVVGDSVEGKLKIKEVCK